MVFRLLILLFFLSGCATIPKEYVINIKYEKDNFVSDDYKILKELFLEYEETEKPTEEGFIRFFKTVVCPREEIAPWWIERHGGEIKIRELYRKVLNEKKIP